MYAAPSMSPLPVTALELSKPRILRTSCSTRCGESWLSSPNSVKERQGDPIELTKLKVRADEIEKEIATLIDKIVSASPATMEYINERIDALDEEKKNVREQIAQMSAEMYGKRNMETISGYINDWERIDMDDKLTVVDALIDNIRVGRGDVQITWKI